jgi:hypothetical protein
MEEWKDKRFVNNDGNSCQLRFGGWLARIAIL